MVTANLQRLDKVTYLLLLLSLRCYF